MRASELNRGVVDMNRQRVSARLQDAKGSVALMVIVSMVLLFGFAAFGVDVGYMMVRRNELQNIADTAALAAAGDLGAQYAPMTHSQALAYAPPADPLLATAQHVVDATAGSGLAVIPQDLKLGKWDPAARKFTSVATGPTAVNVTVHRSSSANGPFATIFAGFVGVKSFDVSATATASFTSLSNVPEGGVPLPVGISRAWLTNPALYCSFPIKLYPTNSTGSCAGWHVYDETVASADALKAVLDALKDGSYVSPETTTGTTQYNFIGGNVADAMSNMKTLFDAMKGKNDGVLDKDNDSTTWTTVVAVYDAPDCANPSGNMAIIGFSTVVVKSVSIPPAPQLVQAQVVCDSIISGSGGGGYTTGTMGTIPNLVQ